MAALAPVTDGDALCYHLQVPKVFLIRQAVFFDPDLHETVYPAASPSCSTRWPWSSAGPVACRCVQWLLGLVFAANVTALARPSLGRRAWWAGDRSPCWCRRSPTAWPRRSTTWPWPRSAPRRSWPGPGSIDRPSPAAALVAGAFAGLAIGVKYPALVLAGLLAVLALHASLSGSIMADAARAGSPSRCGLAAGFPRGMTVLVGGAWYLRAYVSHGESRLPVLPAAGSAERGSTRCSTRSSGRWPVSLWNLLTALVPLTLEPDRFDSFAHQFGPVFLLFLPALLLERSPAPGARAGVPRLCVPDALPDAAAEHAVPADRPGADVGRRGLPGDRWTTARTSPRGFCVTALVLVLVPRGRPGDDAGGTGMGVVLGRRIVP